MEPYYIFELSSPIDQAYVRQRQTVNIEGSLFVFRSITPQTIPNNLLFHIVPIWIRVKHLPLPLMNSSVAAYLLSHVGEICEEKNLTSLLPPCNFIRVKVWVDLSKPLIPGCYLTYDDREHHWISFSYEGVFRFCKTCGQLGHRVSFCPFGKVRGARSLRTCLSELRNRGLQVLHGLPGSSFYMTEILGLPSRLKYLNFDLDTTSNSDPVILDSGGASPVFSFSTSPPENFDIREDLSREVLLESHPLIRGPVLPPSASVAVVGETSGGRTSSLAFRLAVPEDDIDNMEESLNLGVGEPCTPPQTLDVGCLFHVSLAPTPDTDARDVDSRSRTINFVYKRKR